MFRVIFLNDFKSIIAPSGHGIEVDYQEHPWGTVVKFRDPDGNFRAFKDDEKFEQQIAGG